MIAGFGLRRPGSLGKAHQRIHSSLVGQGFPAPRFQRMAIGIKAAPAYPANADQSVRPPFRAPAKACASFGVPIPTTRGRSFARGWRSAPDSWVFEKIRRSPPARGRAARVRGPPRTAARWRWHIFSGRGAGSAGRAIFLRFVLIYLLTPKPGRGKNRFAKRHATPWNKVGAIRASSRLRHAYSPPPPRH